MDVREVVALQVEMYGEPLARRFGRLLAAYGVSQARLASVLGLSPPMLSQLMSGQRAKISNPAVFGRLVRLEALADRVGADPDARAAALNEVQASRPTLHTGQVITVEPDPTVGARALVGLVPPDVLARAAGEVSDQSLAAILRAASRLR